MYDVSDIRNGLKIEYEGTPYEVVYFQHVKPGKGNAFTRTKLRNLMNGYVQEYTFRSGEKFAVPDCEQREMNVLYEDGDGFNLIDNTNFEQIVVPRSQLGERAYFVIEGMTVQVLFYKGKPLDIELPMHVIMEVTEADPNIKGDSATNVTKNATIQTGKVIQVPMFIEAGEKIKIDTRDGRFMERAK